jgi:hypothetical protein
MAAGIDHGDIVGDPEGCGYDRESCDLVGEEMSLRAAEATLPPWPSNAGVVPTRSRDIYAHTRLPHAAEFWLE